MDNYFCTKHQRYVPDGGACIMCRNDEDKKFRTGIELIAGERQRQIDVEGWTEENDYQNRSCSELAVAAACYALHAASAPIHHGYVPVLWPWPMESWKPKDPLRDLIRAGALIAAEIDRLQREEKSCVR